MFIQDVTEKHICHSTTLECFQFCMSQVERMDPSLTKRWPVLLLRISLWNGLVLMSQNLLHEIYYDLAEICTVLLQDCQISILVIRKGYTALHTLSNLEADIESKQLFCFENVKYTNWCLLLTVLEERVFPLHVDFLLGRKIPWNHKDDSSSTLEYLSMLDRLLLSTFPSNVGG